MTASEASPNVPEEPSAVQGVLVIYTGGTIGSKPRDPDPDSPQIVVPWEVLRRATPEIDRLPFPIVCNEEVPPLDSCNVGPNEWQMMARIIEKNYEQYAGFVILHGTDTMVYTASALSFMLRNLGKPVIVTGAQRSALVSVRNDATQNFLTALEIANPAASRLPIVPEVCILFGGKLLRGNRAIKRDTVGYEAYETPNLAPLGEIGDRIVINESIVRPLPPLTSRFNVRPELDPRVLPIFISPGIQETEIVGTLLATEGIRAAVVQSFGSGNIPTKESFLEEFRSARERGIVVANVGQCSRGPVELGIYETSAALVEAGFISGNDITVEAAQCKLMSLLGDSDMTIDDIEERFQQDLAGELSTSLILTPYGSASGGELNDEIPRHRIPGVTPRSGWTIDQVERVLLRLRGAQLTPGRKDAVDFELYINLAPSAEASPADAAYAGSYRKWASGATGLMVFDVTAAFRATFNSGDRTSFTIVSSMDGARLTWASADLAIFAREY